MSKIQMRDLPSIWPMKVRASRSMVHVWLIKNDTHTFLPPSVLYCDLVLHSHVARKSGQRSRRCVPHASFTAQALRETVIYVSKQFHNSN
jgi:hypothetical protein